MWRTLHQPASRHFLGKLALLATVSTEVLPQPVHVWAIVTGAIRRAMNPLPEQGVLDWGDSRPGEGAMGYEAVERNLAAFDEILARLGVKLSDDSPIKKDFDTTREFL